MTTAQTIREILAYCAKSGEDPILAVQDYFSEKGSHFTRSEIERIIERNK